MNVYTNTNVRFHLSNNTKTTLKMCFCHEKSLKGLTPNGNIVVAVLH